MHQYLGEIRIFLQHNIPIGFLICNGQEVFINEYPRLYMVIGCRYGGDEKTKFRLPNINHENNGMMVFCIATEGEKSEFNKNI